MRPDKAGIANALSLLIVFARQLSGNDIESVSNMCLPTGESVWSGGNPERLHRQHGTGV